MLTLLAFMDDLFDENGLINSSRGLFGVPKGPVLPILMMISRRPLLSPILPLLTPFRASRVEMCWPEKVTAFSSPTREVAEERIEDSLRNSGHMCDPKCALWRDVCS
jgi:hypothetical protein